MVKGLLEIFERVIALAKRTKDPKVHSELEKIGGDLSILAKDPNKVTAEQLTTIANKLDQIDPPNAITKIDEIEAPSVTNRPQGKSADMYDSAERSIQFVAEKTGLSFEEARLAIMEKMNQGYEIGDLKRTMPNDMASIKAYLDTNLDYSATDAIEFLEDIEEIAFSGAIDLSSDTAKVVNKTNVMDVLDNPKTFTEIQQERGVGQFADDAPKTLEDTFKNVPPERRAVMEELYAPIIEEQKIIEATQKEIQQTAAKIQDLIEQGRVDEAEALAESLRDFQTQLKSTDTALNATIIPPKRTLNAKGGRIGFAAGGLAGLYRFLTGAGKAGKAAKAADQKQMKEITDLLDQQKNDFNEFKMIVNEERIAKGQPPIRPDSKENNELFKEFKSLEESGVGEDIKKIFTTEQQLIDEGYDVKEANEVMDQRFFSEIADDDPDRTLNAQGGRIGFQDGSDFKGGPKIGRRGFLGLMGAGIASLFIPTRAAKVATTAAKAAPEIAAQGMPNWFPLLVNKIKKQGKQIEFATGGRHPDNVYSLKVDGNEYLLTEDAVNGSMDISTRGDDFQQVSFEYIPPTEYRRPDGKAFTEDAEFYAHEFMKGGDDIPDYENTLSTIDDLRLGINSIEEFAKKGNKTPAEKLDEIAAEFKTATTKEDIDGFAKGGRVGYKNGGGVGTLFKEKRA